MCRRREVLHPSLTSPLSQRDSHPDADAHRHPPSGGDKSSPPLTPGSPPPAAARADARLLALCVILGVTRWTELCRLLRGEAMKLREQEYIQAAQAFGVSSLRIMTRHIVPNVMHIVLISVVMGFSSLVLAEAVLSYIGVGVDPTTISFGNMINAARMELGREPVVWWPLASAFFFMLLLVLAANLFADAVRDAFDPRLNRA